MISVSAASGKTIAIALAYAAGSAAVLLVLALGGRRVFERVRAAGRGPALQRALGVIMILTALAIMTNLDVNFDQFVAQHIPDVNVTAALECSPTVTGRLSQITGRKAKFAPANGSAACGAAPRRTSASRRPTRARRCCSPTRAGCPTSAPRPNSPKPRTGSTRPAQRPLALSSLRGHVVLVDFWTYTCINCIRTLPYLEAWDAAYRKDGLTIIGVEAPEFPFERDAGNVENAIQQFGIHYPVVQDNKMATWDAYGNEYWPADYLIDAHGDVRYTAFGEGDYDKTETAIRSLLAEAGAQVGGKGHPSA